MEKNLTFKATLIEKISIKTAWPNIELVVSEEDEIKLIISGDDSSVSSINIDDTEGKLNVEQRYFGITKNYLQGSWMQIVLSLPSSYNGHVSINTVTGPCIVRGYNGNSLKIDSMSGDIKLSDVKARKIKLTSVNASISAKSLQCDTIKTKSVIGKIFISDLNANHVESNSVSSSQTYDITNEYESLEFLSVSGDIDITQIYNTVDVQVRSVNNSLVFENVTQEKGAPSIKISAVSANMKIKKSERN